jgi:hypothetical protein
MLLTVSYSTTFLILARALRCISYSLTLQMTGLIIRHPAYPGLPGIDLRLTSSADEICAYFGLDRARWEAGFDNEEQVWEWLATVEEGGKLEGAYKRMVRPKAVRQKGHKNKAGALDGFVTFLRGTKHGEGWENMTPSGGGGDRTATPVPTPVDTSLPPLSPSTMTTMSTSPPLTPQSGTPSTSVQSSADMIDPENPVPLDSHAEAALERWGKREAYDALLAERKAAAIPIAASQRKRQESKQKALEEARRKLEEDEEKAMGGSLAAAVEAIRI